MPLVGGPEYSDKLLETLELISGIQEQYVRDEVHSFFPLSNMTCSSLECNLYKSRDLIKFAVPSAVSQITSHSY